MWFALCSGWFLGIPTMEDIKYVIHAFLIEVERFEDEGINCVVFILTHTNKIIAEYTISILVSINSQ